MRKFRAIVTSVLLALVVFPLANINMEALARKLGWDQWLVRWLPWLFDQDWFLVLLGFLTGVSLMLWIETKPQEQERKSEADEVEGNPEEEDSLAPQPQRQPRAPHWWHPAARNVSVLRALHYIATRDWGGQASLKELQRAGVELRDKAAEGEMAIWGRPDKHRTIEKIDGYHWSVHGFDWVVHLDDEFNFRTEQKSGRRRDNYMDLQTSKERVEHLWPPA